MISYEAAPASLRRASSLVPSGGGEGCGLGLEDEAGCDTRDKRVCSYYSACDNKTTKREHHVTKHSYCKFQAHCDDESQFHILLF